MQNSIYKFTIQKLKDLGLMEENDSYAFGKFYDKLSAGGAYTFRWSSVDYLIAANETTLKIFHINKKNGEYMNEYVILKKEQINKLICKRFALINITKRTKINIRASEFKLDVLIGEKFHGMKQSENKAALVKMLKTYFVKH